MSLPQCPRCRTAKDVRPQGERNLFICGRCNGMFDNDPNEGGDYADHRPDIRIEREERRRQNQARDRFFRR